jgi:hypothetical protein
MRLVCVQNFSPEGVTTKEVSKEASNEQKEKKRQISKPNLKFAEDNSATQ